MTMRTALIIRPDGTTYIQETATDLASLQRLVGGYIEAVHLDSIDSHAYVNEEGKFRGLRFNPAATAFLDAVTPGSAPHGRIRGTMVVLGNGPDGDEADLPVSRVVAVLRYTGALV